MTDGWQVRELNDIADVRGGKRVPKGYRLQSEPTGHPYITVSDFTDDGTVDATRLRYVSEPVFEEIKRYTISSEDLYVSIAGTIGKTGCVPPELDGASLTENACKLVLRPGIDRDYVYYFTQSEDFRRQTRVNTRVAAQPKLSLQRLKTIKIPIPPLHEQQRIVDILDEAFAPISTARENAKKNIRNARALFESHLQSVFARRGDGRWIELSEVCGISSTLVDPRLPECRDLPHVGGANMVSMTGGLIGVKTAHEEGLKSGKFLFDETMVLYSKIRPYLLKVVRPDFAGLCSADVYPLSAKQDQLDRDFLFHLLLSPEFTEYAIAGSARAGMPKVNREHLFAFRVHLPSLASQKRFAMELDGLHGETQRLESVYQRKLDAVDELKKSLLHQAFSGDL